MKNAKYLLLFFLAFFSYFYNVNAQVKENAFTDEKCTISTSWQSDVKTNYKLNTTKGVFELTGTSYKQSDKNTNHIFYDVSEDGSVLYAYIPNYNEAITNSTIKETIYNAGIITTGDCDKTLIASKTIIGSSEKTEPDNQDKKDSKKDKDNTQDIIVPNTGSTIKKPLIVLGTVLVIIGLVLVLQKNGKIKIGSKNNQNKNNIWLLLFGVISITSLPMMINATIDDMPSVLKIGISNYEQKTLEIDWNSNSEGSDYTVEIFNSTLGKINRISNSVTQYTYQKLESKNIHRIALRVCKLENKKYICSKWSNVVEGVPTTDKIDDIIFGINDGEKLSQKEINITTYLEEERRLLQEKELILEATEEIYGKTSENVRRIKEELEESYTSINNLQKDSSIAAEQAHKDSVDRIKEEKAADEQEEQRVKEEAERKARESAENEEAERKAREEAEQAAQQQQDEENRPLTKLSLDVMNLTLNKDETKQISVIYNPSNTTDDKTVTWTSSDNEVATVENGKITAVSKGKTKITATVGDKTATCNITVNVPLTSISLNESEITLEQGKTKELIVNYNPSNTTDSKTVTWISSDKSVVTVENGNVTAVGGGTATITAKVGSKVATTKVTVTSPLNSISLNKKAITIDKGEQSLLSVAYNPKDTTADKSVTWTSSDPKIATVTNGKVIGLSVGKTTVTATVGDKTANCEVTVNGESLVPLQSISLNQTKIDIDKGDTENLIVNYSPSNTTDEKTVIWTSSNSEIATVVNGKITGLSEGKVTITAKVGDKTATCEVTIHEKQSDIPLESISLSKEKLEIEKGNNEQLSVTYNPSNTTDDKTVIWTSSNPEVATVVNGKITGLSEGKVTITAKVGDKTATCEVTIHEKQSGIPLESISLSKAKLGIEKGNNEQLSVTYNPSNTTDDKTVTWTSSKPEVATVSNGKITAIKPGTTIITAKVGDKTATCEVTVESPLEGIELSDYLITINKGSKKSITVTYNPVDTTADKTVVWTSSNTNVAIVNNGEITAINPGTATITAKVGNKEVTCEVGVVSPLKKILLNKEETKIEKGNTERLTVTYNPEDTTDDKTVTWTSSKPEVATVEDGNVTAVSNGTTTITAKVGDQAATCEVTVISSLISISLNKELVTINKGDTEQLTVTYNPVDTTDDKTVTWTSSNLEVVTVSNGKVTGVGSGTATITAKAGNKEVTCIVTVKVPLVSISLNKELVTINKGNTEQLTVTYNPEDTTDDKTVTWTSSNPEVATVSNGKITALDSGTTTITAKVGDKTETCVVKVNIPLESINLNKTETVIQKDEEELLAVSYNPVDTTDDKTVVWTSSNPGVATVVNGKIKAISEGTAIITAKVGDKTSTCTVTVEDISDTKPLQNISLNKTAVTIKKEDVEQLIVNYNPIDTTDDKTVIWTSSNPEVATVVNGAVTAVSKGETTITAKVGDKTATCEVTVTSPLVSISLNKELVTINKGDTEQLTVTYNPVDTTDEKTVIWTSSNSEVATVSNGQITAIKPGTTIITAKVGDKTATCEVKVKSPLKSIEFEHDEYLLNIEKGNSHQLNIVYNPVDTTVDKTVTWTSSDPEVATVVNGKITAIKPGTAIITAKVEDKTVSCEVGVTSPLKSISLNEETKTLNKGNSDFLAVTYNPEDTTDDKTVTWTSSDPEVATVVNGVIIALNGGNTTITAQVGDKTATCLVTVVTPLERITLNESSIRLSGVDTKTLTVTYNPIDTTEDKTVIWYSSNTNVATVVDGVVSGIGNGTAIITAQVGDKIATCEVTVEPEELVNTYFLKTQIDGNNANESILLKTKDDKYVLIDTGDESSSIQDVIYNKLKSLQNNDNVTIDYLILSHMHNDHVGNATWLCQNENIDVKHLVIKEDSLLIDRYREVRDYYRNNCSSTERNNMGSGSHPEGEEWQIGDYLSLYFYNVLDVYNSSQASQCNAKTGSYKKLSWTASITADANYFQNTAGNYIYFDGSNYPDNFELQENNSLVTKDGSFGMNKYFWAYTTSADSSDLCNSNANSLGILAEVKNNGNHKYMYFPSDLENVGVTDLMSPDAEKGSGIVFSNIKTSYVDGRLQFETMLNPILKKSETEVAERIAEKLGDNLDDLVIYQSSHHGRNNAKSAIDALGINNPNRNEYPYVIAPRNTISDHTAFGWQKAYYYTLGNIPSNHKLSAGNKNYNGVMCYIKSDGVYSCNYED